MRVLVVTPWFPNDREPSAGVFVQRDVELLQRDHDVTVLYLGRPDDLTPPTTNGWKMDVVRHPYSFASPRSVLSAARTVKELAPNYDLVHSMTMSSLLPVSLAKAGRPWVHTEHFGELVNPNLSLPRRIVLNALKVFYRFPTEIVAVSRTLAAAIGKNWPNATWVIGNYVNCEQRGRSNPESRALRIGDPRKISVLSVGNIVEHKGPIQAVDTIALLRERGWDASLVWVGTGPLEGAGKARAQELGVSEHVRFAGHVPPQELPDYLGSADLFLLPTEAETFGVAIAEAIGQGVPVVVSGIGGHREFLPARGSRAVNERSPLVLANAIEELLADPGRMSATELREYALKRFSEEDRRTKYRTVYDHAEARA